MTTPFVYSLSSITQLVVEFIKSRIVDQGGLVTRSELNTLCKATSNASRTELLSTVLLNLVEYGYLHKRLDTERNLVEFWPTDKLSAGASLLSSRPTPDPVGRKSGYYDLMLTGRATPKSDGSAEAPEVPAVETPPVETLKQVEPVKEVVAEPEPEPEMINALGVVSAKARRQAVKQFIRNNIHLQVGELKIKLGKVMKSYLIDRDITYLQDNGELFAVNGRYQFTPPLMPITNGGIDTQTSRLVQSPLALLQEEIVSLSPNDLALLLALARRLNQVG